MATGRRRRKRLFRITAGSVCAARRCRPHATWSSSAAKAVDQMNIRPSARPLAIPGRWRCRRVRGRRDASLAASVAALSAGRHEQEKGADAQQRAPARVAAAARRAPERGLAPCGLRIRGGGAGGEPAGVAVERGGLRARREECASWPPVALHFGWAGKRPGGRAAGGGGTEWRERSMATPTCEQRCGAVGCELLFHNAVFARKACMLVCKASGASRARAAVRWVPAQPGRARRGAAALGGRAALLGKGRRARW